MPNRLSHSVEIWEAGGHIGGNALCACKPFFKRDMHRMIRYFERELLVHDIPVRFYTTATPELAAAYAPDHILWAVGGYPSRRRPSRDSTARRCTLRPRPCATAVMWASASS